jgi:uncharacterized membrane protein YhaH (DUF805 family)
MTDTAKAKRPQIYSYRIGRPMYWACIVLVVLLSLGLGLVTKSNATSGLAVVWIMLYGWRLHDIGRSAWWGLGAVVAMLAIILVALTAAFKLYGADDPRFETTASIGMIVAFLLQLGFTIWLGCARGDEGPNRFGERTTMRLGRFTI